MTKTLLAILGKRNGVITRRVDHPLHEVARVVIVFDDQDAHTNPRSAGQLVRLSLPMMVK
ncbi:MAG: hypothetical protein ABI183_02000 [Polyangiaceae bacterium]